MKMTETILSYSLLAATNNHVGVVPRLEHVDIVLTTYFDADVGSQWSPRKLAVACGIVIVRDIDAKGMLLTSLSMHIFGIQLRLPADVLSSLALVC
jgi:hypothetical protein